jgi:RNA ligase (TIGR02306 family)
MENNNSVCFVATVNEIKPIEGADNIEQVVVGGWNCISQKNTYKINDFVIVATTDAVIPIELSDSLNVTNYLRKGQRVRTVKLRGVYSECLLIPMKFNKQPIGDNYSDGKDMMEIMSITKYEPPVKQIQLASGKKIRYQDNPNFHIYYKFPNVKNVPGMFDEDDMVEISRKIHGTNARYGIVKKKKLSIIDKVKKFFGNEWIEYEYVYGSHNVEKGSDSQGFYSTDVWQTIAEKYNIREKLWDMFKLSKRYYNIEDSIVIYGEIYGAGIQKNYDYGLSDIDYVGFDTTINGEYCDASRSFIIQNELGLPYVPVLAVDNWSQELQDNLVFNNFIKGTKVPHEGIVIKALNGDRHKVAKVINPDYLIYGEKHNIGDSH